MDDDEVPDFKKKVFCLLNYPKFALFKFYFNISTSSVLLLVQKLNEIQTEESTSAAWTKQSGKTSKSDPKYYKSKTQKVLQIFSHSFFY